MSYLPAGGPRSCRSHLLEQTHLPDRPVLGMMGVMKAGPILLLASALAGLAVSARAAAADQHFTVAPQALSLLNSPLAVEAARPFAGRVHAWVGDVPVRQIERAFQLALRRRPGNAELEACGRRAQAQSLLEVCRAWLNLNEFIYVD